MSHTRLLITAGPTREPIDAVRFIGNRSSGKLGIALARAATDHGHDVTLLLGPVTTPVDLPESIRVGRCASTAVLQALLAEHFAACDVLIMAAAVADYRPAQAIGDKLPRSAGKNLTMTLEPTPDLVGSLAPTARADQRIIAFALEPADTLTQRAQAKLQRKGVHAIVANPLETMDSDTIQPTWITRDQCEPADRMSKQDFARWLLERVDQLRG